MSAAQRRSMIEQRVGELPVLPPSVLSLVSADAGSNDFQGRVQWLVERDPALASRIAALANRVDPEASEPVRSLPQAVARIGARRAGRLITTLTLLRVFPPDTEERRGLWRHALLVATAAREIARASGHAAPLGEAYAAGLLHDIGRFVLVDGAPDELRAGELPGWAKVRSWVEDERRAFGCDHAEVGYEMCLAWNLAHEPAEIVRLHHELEADAELASDRQRTLLRIVQQADRLSCLLAAVPQLEEQPAAERLAILNEACVHPKWDWAPAGPTHLDLLIGPILSHGEQLIGVLGLESP